MSDASQTQVLIAGAGPIGMTAAIELARRGIACRIVDPLVEPPRYAKAVGVQPRTLEVFEGIGVLRRILDASTLMRGQLVYVNGERVAGFAQDDDGVTATLAGDGAHSTVRKGLGLTFEGAAFDERYMLGDVEVGWSFPAGYGIRAMHQTGGRTDDLLVCIPLPGRDRYRMSMLVPDELGEGDTPQLPHLQAVLDRLSPEPATARNLRWSSVFSISHRIVDACGKGRE